MSFSDDMGLEILNMLLTIGILGVLFYLFISYMDLQTRSKDRLAEYEKKNPTPPKPSA